MYIDGLTYGMTSVIHTAQLLAAGARPVVRTDGIVELLTDGDIRNISEAEYNLARNTLDSVIQEQYLPRGIVTPYSPFKLLDLRPFLINKLQEQFLKKGFRAMFLKGDTGGCAYWRCEEPTRMMMELYGDMCHVEVSNIMHFETLLPYDIIIVQRGLFGEHTTQVMAVIERLKISGRKIVYEIDDDLKTMLPDNNCFYVAGPNQMEAVEWLIDISDAIFTTNETLKASIGRPEKTVVLPNSLDFNTMPAAERNPARDDILLVLWHGGDSHERDINWMEKSLTDLVKKRESLQDKSGKEIIFGFMGYFPKFLEQFMGFKFIAQCFDPGQTDPKLQKKLRDVVVNGRGGIKYIKGVEVHGFHNYLAYINPDIVFCPLLPDHPFNNSKSKIKFLESIAAGAACVVSDVGPYSDIPDNCAIKARTPSQMTQGIQDLILKPDYRKSLHANGLAWCKENFTLQNNAKSWYNALAQVAGVAPLPEALPSIDQRMEESGPDRALEIALRQSGITL